MEAAAKEETLEIVDWGDGLKAITGFTTQGGLFERLRSVWDARVEFRRHQPGDGIAFTISFPVRSEREIARIVSQWTR